jgi:hypothetical protein
VARPTRTSSTRFAPSTTPSRNFTRALEICDQFLKKYPGQALFQALKFDVEEQQRLRLSSYIAEIDKRVESEPDLERRVNILKEALDRFPEEPHFQRSFRLMRDRLDLVNAIVAKARHHEERFIRSIRVWSSRSNGW